VRPAYASRRNACVCPARPACPGSVLRRLLEWLGGDLIRVRLSNAHGTAPLEMAGAEHTSDPMPFRSAGLEPVTVTVYLAEPTGPATYHAQALTTSVSPFPVPAPYTDAVIELDRALARASGVDGLDPAFDSGDQLHANDAGCQAMADAVDLADLG